MHYCILYCKELHIFRRRECYLVVYCTFFQKIISYWCITLYFMKIYAYCAHYVVQMLYAIPNRRCLEGSSLDFKRQLMSANSFTTPYLIWNPWHSVKSDHMAEHFPLACIRIAECHQFQQHVATNIQMHTHHTYASLISLQYFLNNKRHSGYSVMEALAL